MPISRMHPCANWLRLPAGEHRRALDRVLLHRDQQLLQEPQASGLPPAAVDAFWNQELPVLLQRPEVRAMAEARVLELEQQAEAINDQVQRQAGCLLDQLAVIRDDGLVSQATPDHGDRRRYAAGDAR